MYAGGCQLELTNMDRLQARSAWEQLRAFRRPPPPIGGYRSYAPLAITDANKQYSRWVLAAADGAFGSVLMLGC